MTNNFELIAEGHSLRIVRDNSMGPDDGNPYFVEHKAGDYGASLPCALDTCELTHNRSAYTFRLTPPQMLFLNKQADKLADF
jgi:hypothetical protein